MSYKDPKRKVGSQSETPKIKLNNDLVIVSGYQTFNISKFDKNIQFISKPHKFSFISNLFNKLNKEEGCKTICDIGCSAGLCSLIAHNNNFNEITSLDHDIEYIETLTQIKNLCNITNINEKVFSFGEKMVDNKKFDVVFCGALIHWIFSLTADFRNFDKIINYLLQYTGKYLIIEWICKSDRAISCLKHISKNSLSTDEVYSTENFEKAINKKCKIISKDAVDKKTRILYVLKV